MIVDVERGVEVLDGEIELADGDQALRTCLIGRRDEGIAVDRIVEIGDGAGVVADQPAARNASISRFSS